MPSRHGPQVELEQLTPPEILLLRHFESASQSCAVETDHRITFVSLLVQLEALGAVSYGGTAEEQVRGTCHLNN